MAVFVLDKKKRPLMPCSERKARLLLKRGRAVVARLYPFTIRLKDRLGGELQPVRVKIDPGSKTSGIAVVRDIESADADTGELRRGAQVLSLLELEHRGQQIRDSLTSRRAFRRRRRGARLRYRAARFSNRRRPEGWLPPSLRHRVDTTICWVQRQRLAPITALSMELVRFDLQKIENPEISGVQYQQGTLAGYELKEYLLEKFGRACVYCDKSGCVLNVEHIDPRARGGSDRVSNLVIACLVCNPEKGAMPITQFLAHDPARLARILAQAKAPLKDATAVNATRWALANALKARALPLELSSGGRTKFNRMRLGIPKTHALDAACVGKIEALEGWSVPTLEVKAMGRGAYCRTRLTAHGFPRGYLMRGKQVHGFQTGDRVRAEVPTGKRTGVHVGRVAVRASGSFNVQTPTGTVQGVPARHCTLIHRGDGYSYQERRFLPRLKTGVSAPGVL
jgi:5-methylcytosine-specific restriction endonuclease McrA